jgi:hypothetical protein
MFEHDLQGARDFNTELIQETWSAIVEMSISGQKTSLLCVTALRQMVLAYGLPARMAVMLVDLEESSKELQAANDEMH